MGGTTASMVEAMVRRRDSILARTALLVWHSRDAAAHIALSSLLRESGEAHFSQVWSAKDFFTAIKSRYSTPTFTSLGRLFMPNLFPDLGSFDCTVDLVAQLRSLDASYRAACTEAQLTVAPPPMHITIRFIATSIPDRLASLPHSFRGVLSHSSPSLLLFSPLMHLLLLTRLQPCLSLVGGPKAREVRKGGRVVAAVTAVAAAMVAEGVSEAVAALASCGGGTGGGIGPVGPTDGGARLVDWYTAQQ
ncbi:unnamed protein product [Closterium sp. NIES-54]